MKLNKIHNCNMRDEDIYKVASSRFGWHRLCRTNVVNYLFFPPTHFIANKSRPGLVDLTISVKRSNICFYVASYMRPVCTV